jgi:hypothetical protein
MQFIWQIEQDDIAAVRDVIARHRDHPIVRDRIARNLAVTKSAVTRERFWRTLVMALLTTQQPSGPTSAVSRLLVTDPFPLRYASCLEATPVGHFATGTLVAFGGIRRHGKIGAELEENLTKLESGLWPVVLDRLNALRETTDKGAERAAADLLTDNMKGLGPKQARNVLQALGLTRYGIPIDSRIAKWLRATDFPVPLSATALADRGYYAFILDGVQHLCEVATEFPCVLDGAVFASFDGKGWNEQLVTF